MVYTYKIDRKREQVIVNRSKCLNCLSEQITCRIEKLLAIDFEACVFLNADKDYGTTDNRISR